jgi:hypothetical protein
VLALEKKQAQVLLIYQDGALRVRSMELIKGCSGCKLRLHKVKNRFVVSKSTNDIEYADRLERQCFKQKQYRGFFSENKNIIIPKVIYEVKTNTSFLFKMEYYLACDSLTFLENSNLNNIDLFIKSVLQIIDTNINNSTYRKIEKRILLKKLNSVKKSITNEITKQLFFDQFKRADKYLEKLEDDIVIPMGACHGDFTLSNILIQNNKLILIDFLDSFIETPLQDIVKIRQDTAHLWSLGLIDKDIDETKLKIILAYLDEYVKEYYQENDFMKYYDIFQVINLLRIIPYVQDKKLLNNIKTELDKIYRRI